MTIGRKITIFLVNGDPYGPRIAEIGNWTGKAIYSPRISIENTLKREDMKRPAVYILKSTSTHEEFTEKVYIGQGSVLANRIKDHLNNNKDDWSEFIGFISKDELLTSSQIKYLESRLIRMSLDAKTVEVSNSQVPKEPLLSESDIADMEYFLEQIKLILPLMGFRMLMKSVLSNEEKKTKQLTTSRVTNEYCLLVKKVGEAKMIESDEGYVVLSGSVCNKKISKSMSEGWLRLREDLINKKLLLDRGSHFEFIADVIFNSPSAAASVVLGRQAAGPIQWRDADSQETFKDIKSRVVVSANDS
ncbi:GIY-YIG nuclease family protein [Paenibacillus pabuli]|uniref:GIY-YIG nuclease family protein n=1 Tax=Paenibacillus pabuli TaxID=1472 RepID=UPI00345A567F